MRINTDLFLKGCGKIKSSSKLVRHSICCRAIGEADKSCVRECVLQWRWASSSAIQRETKRRENDYFVGEGI